VSVSNHSGQLREFLNIPQAIDCTVERYSDSASSYVTLDSANIPVYKQLHRAAKAKQKLKLKVTTVQKEDKMVPKPVTVEDEPEPSQSPPTQPDLTKFDEPVTTPSAPATPAHADESIPKASKQPSTMTASQVRVLLHHKIRDAEMRHGEMEQKMKLLAASVANLNVDPPAGPSATQQHASTSIPVAAPPAYKSLPAAARPNFTVCCNSCDKTIPDSHFHCATCDDGDFDLCQDCVDKGITCFGAGHWLIKRTVKNGMIVSSTTEKIAPKPNQRLAANLAAAQATVAASVAKSKAELNAVMAEALHKQRHQVLQQRLSLLEQVRSSAASEVPPMFGNCAFNTIRTCNCCVQGTPRLFCQMSDELRADKVAELPEHDFVHCTTCEDFDLCKSCFAKDRHGHHPQHAFIIVAPDSLVTEDVVRRLAAGRNQKHHAICDGCDKYIVGVRHKCLDCPDWDYCNGCVANAGFIHANHRFVPIYEAIDTRQRSIMHTHVGISCDGPLCKSGLRNGNRYIVGDRYKCAVCHDTDFCGNCEASPANGHNKTHPLIKFKTPVRHVSVTTTGEREDGNRMPLMGDRLPIPVCERLFVRPSDAPGRTVETAAAAQPIAATNVQTVVDMKPFDPEVKAEEKTAKEEVAENPKAAPDPAAEELSAIYVKDTVADGTVMPPDHVFEQTWVLRNSGNVAWPAGCAVKYVGGDYMGHVDPKHPVAVQKLVPAFESTVCYAPLAPGQSYAFTVLLRTPAREGRSTSYWRLTTKDGIKFGHRLWCDVEVRHLEAVAEKKVDEEQPVAPVADEAKSVEAVAESQGSQMIFPKLEKESPVASVHEEAKSEIAATAPETADVHAEHEIDDFEGVDEDGEWDDSDAGVLTDEEYDILDASDEEALDEDEELLKK
jgi:next-to-BRCA1 protein 1